MPLFGYRYRRCGNCEICGGWSLSHLEKELVGQLGFVVIVEGARLRGSQSISQYLSTLDRWWNHMSHGWLSAPTKLIDEKKTCVMVLGPTGEVGVAAFS